MGSYVMLVMELVASLVVMSSVRAAEDLECRCEFTRLAPE